MGKKRVRKKFISAGKHSNVASKHNFDTWDILDREMFKVAALRKGKRVVRTMPNPDKSQTNALFIRAAVKNG